jgi:predicted aldo/keto reductase-like oxidoreductase
MNTGSNEMDRRSFLKSGAIAAAGAALLGPATLAKAAPTNKEITFPAGIPTRPFGKTGHVLPVLGHGGSAMVNSWESAYMVKLGSEDDRVKMVRDAYDKGMRYFDTARVYSESERIMGTALKDVRDNCYIATKVADPRAAKTRESLEKSLSELGTDYVDCLQIHSPAIEAVGADAAMKVYEEIAKLRDEGLVRFIGLTTHVAFEDVYKMIDTGLFDQCLLAKGYMRRGMTSILKEDKVETREKCVARAHELGMAIVAMKVMGANLLGQGTKQIVPAGDPEVQRKVPAAAIRYVLSDTRVSMLNIGVSTPSDIENNLATLAADTTYTDADKTLLASYSELVYASDYVKAMPLT